MELILEQKYRQTEVGLIPLDWNKIALKETSSFITKGSTPTTYGYNWVSDGVLFLRSECVTKDGLDLKKSMFISEEAHCTLKRSEIQSCDILMTITGNVGRLVMLDKSFGKGNINQHIARIRIIKDEIKREYIFSFLNQPTYRKYFESIVTGQAYPQISLTQVREAYIYYPSTNEEQTAIATALSDADGLIANLEKLISKKRNIKQGAMQELLCPKEGWKVKKLGDIVDFLDGQRKPIKDIDRAKMQGVYPYYGASGIIDYVNDYLFEDDLILLGEDGENIISRSVRLAFKVSGKIWVNNHAHVLKPKSDIDITFLCELLESLNYEQYNSGTAQPKLNKRTVSEISVTIPGGYELQRQTGSILSDMHTEIEALERKLTKYKEIKQGMMQVLLTGKVRLTATATTKRTIELTPQPANPTSAKGHNAQFNEAVLIAVLAGRYGSNKYPLSRFRYTKFLYLFHRQVEGAANGFLKKAAGPYNPSNRYGGPEGIAVKNKYVQLVENKGYIAHDNIDDAKRYFGNWYHDDALTWLDKFRFYKNDQLELLTTVDMAVDDLKKAGKTVNVASVKAVIEGNKDWKPKLKKEFFNDIAIAGAIAESKQLFNL